MANILKKQGLSFIEYEADGSTQNFSFHYDYMSQDDIRVFVNGAGALYSFLNYSEVQITPTIEAGDTVLIRRSTYSLERLVDFEDSGQLKANILDLDSNQIFFLAQEAKDATNFGVFLDSETNTIDAQGARIINVGEAIDDNDALTKGSINSYITEIIGYRNQAIAAKNDAEAAANQASIDADATSLARSQAEAFRDQTEIIKNDTEDLRDQTQGIADQAVIDTNLIKDQTEDLKVDTEVIKGETQAIKDSIVTDVDMGHISEVIFTSQSTPPTNFIATDLKTIGQVGSGADYEGEDYYLLYSVLWSQEGLNDASLTDPYTLSDTKGISPLDDWGVNKVIGINLKDLFIRAKGDARTVGSYQLDAFQGHGHVIRTGRNDSTSYHANGTSVGHIGKDYSPVNYSGKANAVETDGINGNPRTANETRPVNTALYAYIRYKDTAINAMIPTSPLESPLTSKGDLLTNTGVVDVRLPVGPDGYVLTSDASTASGLSYKKRASRFIVNTYEDEGTGTWFEVYNDGWVRQGTNYFDFGTVGGYKTIDLLIPMKHTRYKATQQNHTTYSQTFGALYVTTLNLTTTTFQVYAASTLRYKTWEVEGYGDSTIVTSLGASPSY